MSCASGAHAPPHLKVRRLKVDVKDRGYRHPSIQPIYHQAHFPDASVNDAATERLQPLRVRNQRLSIEPWPAGVSS